MNNFNLSISILAGIGLVGVFVLLGLDKDVSVVLPIETSLLGLLAGLNKDNIVGVAKAAFGGGK
jgi:hypothetical protein